MKTKEEKKTALETANEYAGPCTCHEIYTSRGKRPDPACFRCMYAKDIADLLESYASQPEGREEIKLNRALGLIEGVAYGIENERNFHRAGAVEALVEAKEILIKYLSPPPSKEQPAGNKVTILKEETVDLSNAKFVLGEGVDQAARAYALKQLDNANHIVKKLYDGLPEKKETVLKAVMENFIAGASWDAWKKDAGGMAEALEASESARKEWAGMCIKKQQRIEELEAALKYLMEGVSGLPPLTAIEGTLIKHFEKAKAALEQ